MFIIPLFLGTAKIRLFVLFASGFAGYFVDFLKKNYRIQMNVFGSKSIFNDFKILARIVL
jgi:uncharacterized membrane protein